MPLYDYRCTECSHTFEAKHSFNDPAPACPACGSAVQRIITTVPRVAKGMAADLGKNATKEQIADKWAEETPKLREKLVSKLGEETVARNAPTLSHKYE
jgi:putative FmdB family regulatory protein